jgi:hypothetical protein
MELYVRFLVGAFGRHVASDAVQMFSHLIHFIKNFYKLRIFNNIC